jgi:hypothetical protein
MKLFYFFCKFWRNFDHFVMAARKQRIFFGGKLSSKIEFTNDVISSCENSDVRELDRSVPNANFTAEEVITSTVCENIS